MYIKFLIIALCILTIILIFNKNIIECHEYKDDQLIDYKISVKEKEKINTNNIFNIKEFDEINENIIIHNKFKTELINSKLEKEILESKYLQQKKMKNEKLNKLFDKHLQKEIIDNLKNEINNLKNEISSFNKLFRNDINNLLNDVKKNKLSNNEKQELLVQIQNEKHKVSNKYNKEISNLENNIISNLTNIYKLLLEKKIKLLNKKYTVYNKIIN